jgi:hypothetical protein
MPEGPDRKTQEKAPGRDYVPERFAKPRKCPKCDRVLTEYIDERSRGVMCTSCHTRWPEIKIDAQGKYAGRF